MEQQVPQDSGPKTTSGIGEKGTTSTATQWLGSTSTDPMALLAGGMAQLQAAMLKQMSTESLGERSPETVKPGTTTLPLLPEPRPDTSPVDIMDWLELIATPLSDLSDGSAIWWKKVRKEASRAYDLWANASPLEKLSIMPEITEELEGGKWSRVNSRAASMVLLSLPDSVKTEMVARRLTSSTTSLIYRLMTLYQPGGEAEKLKILQSLSSPPQEQDAQRTVEALRAWDRWLRRCRELHVQAPDPSLLTRGLNHMVKLLLEKHSEAKFRTSLVKSTLGVDTSPTYESVGKYYKHLMGECEALAVAGAEKQGLTSSTTTTPPPPKPEPRLKPVRTDNGNNHPVPPPPPSRTSSAPTTSDEEATRAQGDRSTIPCKFFGKTYKGCARTSKCPFKHSWEGLEKEKNNRCLACGGKAHTAKDCPNKKGNQATTSPTRQNAIPKAPAVTSSSTSSTATNKNVRIDATPEVATIPARETQQSAAAPGPEVDIKEVLADVGKILKTTTTASNRKLRLEDDVKLEDDVELDVSCVVEADGGESKVQEKVIKRVNEDSEDQDGSGLLDSGASNALRPASTVEYNQGMPVKVTLAGEDTKILRQNLKGTVLVEDNEGAIQPIVPMGAVVEELGYSLTWKKGSLRLHHPQKGTIRVEVKNRCPEISSKDAIKLIKDIENHQLAKLKENVDTLTAKLEMMRKEEQRTWDELLKEFVNTGNKATLWKMVLLCPFTKDLPEGVQSQIAEGFDPEEGRRYLQQLPLPRRKRRMLMSSDRWVVDLRPYSSDGDVNPLNAVGAGGKVIVEVNPTSSRLWDMNRPGGAYQLLLWAAAMGKITDVIGSPPCETWPTSRTTSREPDYNPMRTPSDPYGRPLLQPLQQQRLDQETALMAKQMILWLVAMASNKGTVGFLLEMPADRSRHQGSDPIHASFWNTELWKAFRGLSGMRKLSFNMGAYGHRGVRPTVVATNYPMMFNMDGNFQRGEQCVIDSLLHVDQLQGWSKDFQRMVAASIVDFHEGHIASEEELAEMDVKLSKLTKDQREEWKNHLRNDHQPYRSDCSICINAQAYGYQHRRRRAAGLYSVALDLAGPFRQRGRYMEHDDYKYIMVAAYRCPKEYLSVAGLSEEDRELYVPSEEEDDGLFELDEDQKLKDEATPESDGDESEGEELGPETLDEAVEELKTSKDTTTIYLTRPLRRRTAAHVLVAAKEIVMQLRQSGLHVEVIHSDRAREFKARGFKEWTVSSNLRHTKTSGGDPSGNATAELGIKWAKQRVRALIRGSGANPKEWPMAITHAAAELWSRTLPSTPWTSTPATSFGNEVWFRAKHYQGKKEKKHEAAGDRWKKGWYRGPAVDVKRGHLIMREDGGLTVAKSVKFGVRDVENDKELRDLLQPAIADGVPEGEDEEVPMSSKHLAEEIEFKARMFLQEEKFAVEDILEVYRLLEELGNSDTRVSKKRGATSWFTGAYVRGGVAGTRNNLEKFPFTTKYLVSAAKSYIGDRRFAAVGISKNAELGLHRDSHNYLNSANTVVPLTDFRGGSLWIQNEDLSEEEAVKRVTPKGKEVKGYLCDLERGRPVSFSPRLWHEVQPWEGERAVLLAYTPRATKLTDVHVDVLSEHGFPLDPNSWSREQGEDKVDEEEEDPPDTGEPRIRTLRASSLSFEEIEEADLLPGGDQDEVEREGDEQASSPQHEDVVKMMKMVKKAEVQYTQGIEEILKNLEEKKEPLQVTHTVSLQEVRRNLGAWKESAAKELNNLIHSKGALKVTKRHLLPEGCRVVPCKGVYTVKPDKGTPGYRRKTRFVACGNHVPENETTFDVFAAGLDATSLRTMLAFGAKRSKWRWGVTDIRQAFVLAKWLGGPVALQPPAIAYELNLAEEGDMWLVQQAIYGLRESPAMWSNHRDQQLREARWTVDINGKPVVMKLEQLVSDNQVWRIVKEDGQGEPHGYLLVYIDDLLINAGSETMWGFFSWLSAKWEVDDLDVLDEGHSIKFLGTELHYTHGGIEMAQEGFIKELLRSYNHNGSRSRSQGPRETLILSDEEERALIEAAPVDTSGKEAAIKEAQKRVGELLWLMGRTRPDLQHAVSIMSSRITRCPDLVNQIGTRLLDYLCETVHFRLTFIYKEEKEGHLDVFTDSSFAPSGGRSNGCSAVFYNDAAIAWRTGRQTLCSLSTAETELLAALEGAVLGISTKSLLEELHGKPIVMTLLIDNQAAVSLLGSSNGSWRTRHLRVRSNWLKENIQKGLVDLKHQPGEGQRADLGTKPFTRERLNQLNALWGLRDRREGGNPGAGIRAVEVDPSWLTKILLLCQWCGARAETKKEDIKTEIPWDLYFVILILAIAIIGVWEGAKSCLRTRTARVKALKAKATKEQGKKLTRAELKELQRLLALAPEDLSRDQGLRLVMLKEKLDETMPEGSSPLPRFPEEMFGATATSTLPAEPLGTPASSSTSRANKQPKRVETKDVATQADQVFTRVEMQPPAMIRAFSGPYIQVPGADKLHIYPNCWGLRHAGRTQQLQLCRCCAENNGQRIY